MSKSAITKVVVLGSIIGIIVSLSKVTVSESKAQVQVIHEEVEITYLNKE